MSRRDSAMIDIAGEIRAETAKAFQFFDGDTVVWLPKSQCRWNPDDRTMAVPEWLATEKELV